jgi:hypothetical protein
MFEVCRFVLPQVPPVGLGTNATEVAIYALDLFGTFCSYLVRLGVFQLSPLDGIVRGRDEPVRDGVTS